MNNPHTDKLLTLANDAVADFYGRERHFNYTDPYANPEFTKVYQLQQSYEELDQQKRQDKQYLLDEFCIPFEAISDNLYNLMLIIGWLDHATHQPIPYIEGFYSALVHESGERNNRINYYCTLDRYIELLFINLELASHYLDKHAS